MAHASCFTNRDRIVGGFGFRDVFPTADALAEKDGLFVAGHTHNFDHVQEAHGAGIVACAEFPDGRREKTLREGERVLIPAGVLHSARAIDATSWLTCIFDAVNAEHPVTDDGWGDLVPVDMARDRAFT